MPAQKITVAVENQDGILEFYSVETRYWKYWVDQGLELTKAVSVPLSFCYLKHKSFKALKKRPTFLMPCSKAKLGYKLREDGVVRYYFELPSALEHEDFRTLWRKMPQGIQNMY